MLVYSSIPNLKWSSPVRITTPSFPLLLSKSKPEKQVDTDAEISSPMSWPGAFVRINHSPRSRFGVLSSTAIDDECNKLLSNGVCSCQGKRSTSGTSSKQLRQCSPSTSSIRLNLPIFHPLPSPIVHHRSCIVTCAARLSLIRELFAWQVIQIAFQRPQTDVASSRFQPR